QLEREKGLAPAVKKFPNKRYHYAPFCCSRCKCAFKTMEEWASHYHEMIMSGQPCYGALCIMKKATDKTGKTCFRNSNPEGRVKEEPLDGIPYPCPDTPMIPQNGANKKEVKKEPIDLDDTAQQQPMQSQGSVPNDPVATGSSPAAAEVVIKEEPLDEDDAATAIPSTTTTPVKEEPIDEPSTSYDPQREKKEQDIITVDSDGEEEYTFDCEECNIVFHNTKIYVEHMKEHGYELADEKDVAQYEKGEDPDGPAAKKPKEEPPEDSRYPPLLTREAAPSDKWFPCPQCPVMCSSLADFRKHTYSTHDESKQDSGAITYPCGFCKRQKFSTVEEKNAHEKDCRKIQVAETRWFMVEHGVHCPYCGRRQSNVYVLLHHLMTDHMDTLRKLRKHNRMASEFLPFRCGKCSVGFEDPRVLLNHFRLREEFGVPCNGHIEVHSYEVSVQAANRLEERSLAQLIPKLSIKDDPESGDINSNEWCPRDPKPSTDEECNEMVKCVHCNELWPKAQFKLHFKMEHSRSYYDNAPFKCKICKQFGFHNASIYADHYESCKGPGNMDTWPMSMVEVDCAPHYEVPPAPAALRNKMRPIPIDMGNELRACRFCKNRFTPDGLLKHQKSQHPIEHFTDAPYQCQKCDDVGFYAYHEYDKHLAICTGSKPVDLEDHLLAITVIEIEKRTNAKRLEVPSHRALIDADRRRYGALAAFNRPIKCAFCDAWCTSLPTLDEHHKDAHASRDSLTFMCGGCGIYDEDPRVLRKHLLRASKSGNSRCFDMATLNGSDLLFGPPPSQTVDVNKFMMISPSMTRFGSAFTGGMRSPKSSRPHLTAPQRSSPLTIGVGGMKWRSPTTNMMHAHGVRAIVANQAFSKINGVPVLRQPFMKPKVPLGRKGQLLPIRPLNQLSKSPLSGERSVYRHQQILAAARKREAQNSVKEAPIQKPVIKKSVDFLAPLALPSNPSEATSSSPLVAQEIRKKVDTMTAQYRVSIINTGSGAGRHEASPHSTIPRRLSLASTGLPPQFRSRPVPREPAYLKLLNTYTPSNSSRRVVKSATSQRGECMDSPPRLTPMIAPPSRVHTIIKRPGAQEPKQEPY
ncbi:hypothetical protein PMAYCL1PPCAC_32163, partial [Pristionchus mayeri]